MPLTYTGRLVRPGGLEHPSLVDIAVSLSRQPRFGGHCRRWWSVLDHTLFCDELVKAVDDDGLALFWPDGDPPYEVKLTENLRLAVLLHDAHEAITADVPTDVKTVDFKAQQKVLDVVIHNAFFPGGRDHYRAHETAVRRIDRRALCAEAQVVGPPAAKSRILELFGITEELWDDVKLLESLICRRAGGFAVGCVGFLGQPPREFQPEEHPNVKMYVRNLTELL